MQWSEAERSLAAAAAAFIQEAFLQHTAHFRRLTLQARARFEQRDAAGARRDAVTRLDLYRAEVTVAAAGLHRLLGPKFRDRSTWSAIKNEYAQRVGARGDAEIARTFFNSVTRRLFTTVGVDPEVEFTEPPVAASGAATETQIFVRQGSIAALVGEILQHYRFGVAYEDAARDAELVARRIESFAPRLGVDAIELAKPIFYRNKGAYLVGRLRSHTGDLPLVLALLNTHGQVTVDAVLLAEQEVSIVFSFTHSYFLVDTECPGALVRFLRELMPLKPVDELYSSVGYSKHGKTVLFTTLQQHLGRSEGRFDFAPGARGMVMLVFAMPDFDVVFKVIRDRFLPPKTTTRRQVLEKYHLVFHHDRAGRLVGAQEFEHLQFESRRFAPDLLEELRTQAQDAVEVDGDRVVIHHLYTERRVTPLDLYLRQAPPPADAVEAVLDYGEALRDLAATNIFPGDLLLKNFGVTRQRRIVFYDYDELCLLTDCNIRHLPPPPSEAEEWAGEPWFYASDRDVFPEEFGHFLELRGPLRDAFLAEHGDLLAVPFWDRMQVAHRQGLILDLFPYAQERRLRLSGSEG